MIDVTTPTTRELQPRPALYPGAFPGQVTSPISVEPARKKRGRPTKAEHQARLAEAAAKGETWPKPRNKTKGSRNSSSAALDALPGHGTGSMDESGEETGSIDVGRPTTTTSANALINVMNPPMAQTKRGNLQDMIPPAGQAHDDEVEGDGGGRGGGGGVVRGGQGSSTRSESGLSFFEQHRVLPRTSGPPHLQPFSPQGGGHPYHQGGYQSPTTR